MKINNILLITLILIAAISVGAVNAEENNTDAVAIDFDDEMTTEVSDEIISEDNSTGSYSELNKIILNSSRGDTIELTKDYEFHGEDDFGVFIGIGELTIEGNGHSIDANNLSKIFYVRGLGITLNNIVFKNAYSDQYHGGAVLAECKYAFYNNCTFINCYSTGNGGAIYNLNNVTYFGCSFTNCHALGDGGAIYNSNDAPYLDCSFTNCSASSGGAIFNKILSECINCSFKDCSASYYGGALNNAVVNNSNFTDCLALYGGAAANSVVDFSHFNNCTAHEGGAIHVSNAYNSIFENCLATNEGRIALLSWRYHSSGGAIFKGNSTNSTFINCRAVGTDGCWGVGGAISWDNENYTAVNSHFLNCSSTYSSGAIDIIIAYNGIIYDEATNLEYDGVFKNDMISNCEFIGCSSPYGGAVCFNSYVVGVYYFLVTNSTFINCSSIQYGGALNDCSATSSTFINCSTQGYGGAVVGDVVNCLLINCSSKSHAGGVYGYSVNTSFVNCSSEGSGGAVEFRDLGQDIINCSFVNCYSDWYGGAVVGDVVNCSFVNCFSDSYSGAVEGSAINASFVNCSSQDYAGALFGSFAINCSFINCYSVSYASAVSAFDLINCYFEGCWGSIPGYTSVIHSYDVKNCIFVGYSDINDITHDYEFTSFENCRFLDKSGNVIYKIGVSTSSVVYSSGGSFKIKVKDLAGNPQANVKVIFKINGKKVGEAKSDKKGYATYIPKQVPGSYKITIQTTGNVVKTLTVKHIVSLKTVSVKKSAKKLVLQATLAKVNGKYLKSKKITFKFNSKTYKAKTNKYGLAKVTIKSSVLKKLKAGKKIAYSATYVKDTVKKTVKVKK